MRVLMRVWGQQLAPRPAQVDQFHEVLDPVGQAVGAHWRGIISENDE